MKSSDQGSPRGSEEVNEQGELSSLERHAILKYQESKSPMSAGKQVEPRPQIKTYDDCTAAELIVLLDLRTKIHSSHKSRSKKNLKDPL